MKINREGYRIIFGSGIVFLSCWLLFYYLFQPFLHRFCVVFGGNDLRVVAGLREVRAFVTIYPFFERGDAPCFRTVEIVVQYADRLRKGYYQCLVICCVRLHCSSIYCYYSTIYPVLLGTPPMSG